MSNAGQRSSTAAERNSSKRHVHAAQTRRCSLRLMRTQIVARCLRKQARVGHHCTHYTRTQTDRHRCDGETRRQTKHGRQRAEERAMRGIAQGARRIPLMHNMHIVLCMLHAKCAYSHGRTWEYASPSTRTNHVIVSGVLPRVACCGQHGHTSLQHYCTCWTYHALACFLHTCVASRFRDQAPAHHRTGCPTNAPSVDG